jgi:hypothetical protein
MLVQWQEVAAALLQLLERHRRGDIFIGDSLEVPQATAKLDVRYGLDIE